MWESSPSAVSRPVVTVNRWNIEQCEQERAFVEAVQGSMSCEQQENVAEKVHVIFELHPVARVLIFRKQKERAQTPKEAETLSYKGWLKTSASGLRGLYQIPAETLLPETQGGGLEQIPRQNEPDACAAGVSLQKQRTTWTCQHVIVWVFERFLV